MTVYVIMKDSGNGPEIHGVYETDDKALSVRDELIYNGIEAWYEEYEVK